MVSVQFTQETLPHLFKGFAPHEAQSILESLHMREYVAGQFIFTTGQQAQSLYLIQQGLVKVSYISPDGDNKILDLAEHGEIFGELFLGETRFRIGQAQAMQDSHIYVLSEQELYRLLQCHPQLITNFMRHLVDSHRRTMARMHALQQTDAKSRLLGILLYLTRHMCCGDEETFRLNKAITQQDLADLTGLNRSTVSSLINKFRQQGILGGSGRELIIFKRRIEELMWCEGFELLE